MDILNKPKFKIEVDGKVVLVLGSMALLWKVTKELKKIK